MKMMVAHHSPTSRSRAMFSTLSVALVPGGERYRIFLIDTIFTGCVNSYRIIALMLGRLQMDVDTAINYYNDLAKQVFFASKRWPGDGRFKATKLKEVIKSAVRDVTGDPEEPLLEISGTSVCRT